MMPRARFFVTAVAMLSLISTPSQAVLHRNEKATLTVFAASSLGQTFAILGKAFEAKHPGVKVEFSFLASSTLATQIMAGAPVDVFASASISEMAAVKSLVPEMRGNFRRALVAYFG